jgi:hypothetical protein
MFVYFFNLLSSSSCHLSFQRPLVGKNPPPPRAPLPSNVIHNNLHHAAAHHMSNTAPLALLPTKFHTFFPPSSYITFPP